jgi:hypothetical protein
MSPFVSGAAGQQTLNALAAKTAGLDPYLVKLADEIVAAQNELVQESRANPAAAADPLDAVKYPEIAALHKAASVEVKQQTQGETALTAASKGEVSLATAGHECGDYDHPLPTTSPPRQIFGVFKPARKHLTDSGFHLTKGYACGATTRLLCADDYTRDRSYASGQGTGNCSSPRFRDQGFVTGTSFGWIQHGEPNPEIHRYVWPYWNYGNYVQWWHQNH